MWILERKPAETGRTHRRPALAVEGMEQRLALTGLVPVLERPPAEFGPWCPFPTNPRVGEE